MTVRWQKLGKYLQKKKKIENRHTRELLLQTDKWFGFLFINCWCWCGLCIDGMNIVQAEFTEHQHHLSGCLIVRCFYAIARTMAQLWRICWQCDQCQKFTVIPLGEVRKLSLKPNLITKILWICWNLRLNAKADTIKKRR